MEKRHGIDQEILKYLLGELSAEEKATLEERYLTDGDYFEHLLDAEDELIRQYVRDQLAGRERQLFVKHFLSIPCNQERVKFAQALYSYLTKEQPHEGAAKFAWRERMASWLNAFAAFLTPRTAVLKWAYAAAMMVMIFSTSWLLIKTNELGTRIADYESERQALVQQERDWRQQLAAQQEQRNKLAAQLQEEQSRRAELEKELSQQRPSRSAFFAMTLQPGVARGEQEANRFDRRQLEQAQVIKIQLSLQNPKEYKSYRVFLETASEDTIWSQYQLHPQQTGKGPILVLLLPTSILSDDEYLITVRGVTPAREIELVESYYLSLTRE
ncbi:MAG: hypothetical protein ONB44_17665 [candidate division KSB1 bacterium]|nr:hypothetical protein [candidate division KSB1 bacterium]MDZ7303955.1 hypothetical protein [candidate division KSB1 bacterium]MDZ7313699.1 hypothetical protein [candidate division KSB1 bacterium]